MRIFGQHTKGTKRFRSNVTRNMISRSVTKYMGFECTVGPPKFHLGWRIWHKNLADMSTNVIVDKEALDWAVSDLHAKYMNIVKKHMDKVELLTDAVVINGVDGVHGIDAMKRDTSVGFPQNKKKSDYMSIGPHHPDIASNMVFDDEIMQDIARTEEMCKDGKRIYAFMSANLKDEPTQCSKDKVRIFTGNPVVFTFLLRKYLLWIIRLIYNFPFDFESAIGINAYGIGWTEAYYHITKFGESNIVAGDHSAFDKKIPANVMMAVSKILWDMCKIGGYTVEQLTVVRVLLTEVILPIYEFNGTILETAGTNPSGNSLTVIINNIANALYMRSAFFVICPAFRIYAFDSLVSILFYGDDNIFSVHQIIVKMFNHTSIQEVLASWGLKFTMADKLSESVPTIHISSAEFLKRTFLWSEILGRFTAPLSVKSIAKSLHCNHVRRQIPEVHDASVICTANREFFQHGKAVFEERHEQLQQVIDEHDLQFFSEEFLTWDQLVAEVA